MPLHSGTQSLPAALKVATGSYVGDGATSKLIVDPGFRPLVVLVQEKRAVASGTAFLKTSTMTDNRSKPLRLAQALSTTGIISLTKAGFLVGSTINVTSIVYEWVAVGTSASTNEIRQASYTGDGTGARSITGFPFQPDFIMLVEDASVEPPFMWYGSLGGDNSFRWGQAGTAITGKITGVLTNGFTVGTTLNVNGRVYHYWAVNVIATRAEQQSYVGNGVDNRNITYAETNFGPPDFLMIQTDSGVTAPVWRSSSPTLTGDQTMRPGSTVQPEANLIQDITAAASFQVGNNAAVNGNLSNYHYIALKSSAFTPIVSSPLKVNTGQYIGDGVSGRQITGIGFQPRFVITRNITSAAGATALKTDGIPSNLSINWDQFSGGAESTTGILSLDADGFTVGSAIQANGSGSTYIFIAIGGDDAEEVMSSRSFSGTGVDNRQLFIVGFEPDCLLGGRGNPFQRWHMFFRSNGAAVDESFTVDSSGFGPEADFYQQLLVGGFEVGTLGNNTGTHYVTAFKERVGELEQRSYVGNGVDNRNIALVTGAFTNGLSVLFDIKDEAQPAISFLVYRPDFFTVDAGTLRAGLPAPQANMIQDLVGAGNGFQVGTDSAVNTSGRTYHYLGMGDGTPLQAVATAPRLQVSALGPAVSNPDLPIDSIVRAAIQASIPVELLKRLNTLPRLETEFNASTFVSSGQIILPIEILAGLAGNVQMPIDARGTTALATAANMQISFLGRLATDSNLEIEILAGRAMAPHMPVSFIANIATAPHMPVEFLGTVAISTGPHLEIEFLQGVSAPPILPIDQIGVTVLRTTANMPIESLAEIFARATMDVEAAGEGLSIAFVFGVQRKLREPFTFEFIIIPATIIGNILPFTFNVENIMGNILPVSFRVLPDLIITLFGDDIQFPFGRADKNP